MAGKTLRCDHDGCGAVFPPAPVRGRHWRIRTEAEKAGWVSSRTGLYDVDDDADHTIRDYCPEHVDDLDVPVTARLLAQLDAMVNEKFSETWKQIKAPEATTLTLESLRAAIDEIKAGPKPPVIERRGTTIYVNGVPMYELNMPLLADPGGTRRTYEFNFPMDWSTPSPFEVEVRRGALEAEVLRRLGERSQRIIDTGSA